MPQKFYAAKPRPPPDNAASKVADLKRAIITLLKEY